MGSPITGREIIIGLKKATDWGTAVACDAEDGLLITSESLRQTIERHKDNSAALAFVQRTDAGKSAVSGNLEAFLRYEGLDMAIALAMGTAGAPTILGTTAYSNSYVLATVIEGLFATVAMKKTSDKIFEYPSVKIHGFTIGGEMNAPLTISLVCIPDQLELASSTNTIATLANVTYPDKGNRIIMDKNATFKINDESGAALADTDKVYPASFELAFSRPVEGDFVAGSQYISEPAATDLPECTLTLNFPRYNDNAHTLFEDWEAFTRKKMEICLKGALIETTYFYEFKISMPNLKVVDPEAAIGGPGKIPGSMTFDLLGTDTAPEGMTGITKPFQLDVQNTRSTDPLA